MQIRNMLFGLLFAALIAVGCDSGPSIPHEHTFGPNESKKLEELIAHVGRISEDVSIAQRRGLNDVEQLPDKLKAVGADLIENQMREYTATMIGKVQDTGNCWAANVDDRLRANLNSLRDALVVAAHEVNTIKNQDIPDDQKRSKWETFLRALKFKPVLLDPRICSFDTEVIKLKFTDPSETATSIVLPSDSTIKARGYALRRPKGETDDGADGKRLSVFIVGQDNSLRDISDTLKFTTDFTIQIALDEMPMPFKKGDKHLVIRWGNNAVHDQELNIKIDDPDPPIPPPPPKVVQVIVGGRTEGENKDIRKDFALRLFAGEPTDANVVAEHGTIWGGETTYKNQDFPDVELPLKRTFVVPDRARLWVRASTNHDVNAKFRVRYTVETYKWGKYIRGSASSGGSFEVVPIPNGQYTRAFETGFKEFVYNDGNGPNNTLESDFRWEGP